MSTTLTIRNLDERVKQLLRIRAATHARSMEAEAREILSKAVMEPSSAPPAPQATPGEGRPAESVCDSVRGIWKGRVSTDEIMKLTRGE